MVANSILASLKNVLTIPNLAAKVRERVLAWVGQGEITLVPGRRWRNNDAKFANEAATQLLVEFMVSNTTKRPWCIVRAEVVYGPLHRKKFAQMQLSQTAPPGALAVNLMIHFHVHPKPCPDSQMLTGNVVLIDNLNRRHSVGALTFEPKVGPQI